MDKITFREIGVNNIDKYIGKKCIVDGKKFIIISYTTDHPLFLLLLIQKMECGMMIMLMKILVFLIEWMLFLRKCLKELLIHIHIMHLYNVVLYDSRYL